MQVRIDKKILEEARTTLSHMGMDVPTAITVFFLTVIRTGKIPFTIETGDPDDIYTDEDRKRIQEAAEEIERGEFFTHEEIVARLKARKK